MEDLIIKVLNEIDKIKVNIHCDDINSALDSLNELQNEIETKILNNQ